MRDSYGGSASITENSLTERNQQMNIIVKSFSLGPAVIATIVSAASAAAPFREYPIGDSFEKHGMEIAAVWLPPVKMEMDSDDGLDDLRKKTGGQDIHIEADIRAIESNENGFGAGEWIPYLKVDYILTREDGHKISGTFAPMVAKDGPHYGAQVFVPFGKYRLTYRISPPAVNGFGRHTDPITGVAAWWAPFDVSWDFEFKGAEGK